MNLRDAIYILAHVPVSRIVDAVRAQKNCSDVCYSPSSGNITINDDTQVSDEYTIELALQLWVHAKNLGN